MNLNPRKFLKGMPGVFDLGKNISRKLGNKTELYLSLNRFFNRHKQLTFIQIGANDGISNDPFREFILRRDMHGVLVEPLPFLFKKLKNNYKSKHNLIFENCAVSYNTSELEIYTLNEEFLNFIPDSESLSGLASFEKEHILKHIGLGNEKFITNLKVPTKTIENIQSEYNFVSFDCLFMDIEGYESEIIDKIDFEKIQPKLIVYEFIHLGYKKIYIDKILINKGYKLKDCLQDTVAIRDDFT
ncbi:MAG: FkbM family methyltransferase [Cyanomargarita calcarea GSE-NOS-MK-12-04C]|jgi:FkbM family methyltransferase|uniref:FkbM family methyltransferase n=1 Tax=Cyanomargarita calcarea GSE-NOS-MK-12-04C TaxID=2839659 RepID=A0A951QLC8_9CYAN|nr:FkbM family methyltransferase [Cyanomargarita calcarea GSE-NOS-MK-12-04C]